MYQTATQYEITPSDIGSTQVTPYSFSFQGSWKEKESKRALLGLKTAYEMAIGYFQNVQSSRFNGEVSQRIIRRYKTRLNDIEVLLKVVDQVK
jgi:hypothetical protein